MSTQDGAHRSFFRSYAVAALSVLALTACGGPADPPLPPSTPTAANTAAVRAAVTAVIAPDGTETITVDGVTTTGNDSDNLRFEITGADGKPLTAKLLDGSSAAVSAPDSANVFTIPNAKNDSFWLSAKLDTKATGGAPIPGKISVGVGGNNSETTLALPDKPESMVTPSSAGTHDVNATVSATTLPDGSQIVTVQCRDWTGHDVDGLAFEFTRTIAGADGQLHEYAIGVHGLNLPDSARFTEGSNVVAFDPMSSGAVVAFRVKLDRSIVDLHAVMGHVRILVNGVPTATLTFGAPSVPGLPQTSVKGPDLTETVQTEVGADGVQTVTVSADTATGNAADTVAFEVLDANAGAEVGSPLEVVTSSLAATAQDGSNVVVFQQVPTGTHLTFKARIPGHVGKATPLRIRAVVDGFVEGVAGASDAAAVIGN